MSTAPCTSCSGTGQLDHEPVYHSPVEPYLAAPIDFGGGLQWPCPACTDLTGPQPFTGRSPDDTLITWALAGMFDALGIHVSQLQLQRGLDRFERITRTGMYAPRVAAHEQADRFGKAA